MWNHTRGPGVSVKNIGVSCQGQHLEGKSCRIYIDSKTGKPQLQNGGDISIPQLNQYEDGGEYMDLTDEEIEQYRAGGYVVDDLSQQDNGGVYSQDIPYPPKHNPANSFAVNDPRSMQNGGDFEYVDDPNDPRLEDYRIQDILYR